MTSEPDLVLISGRIPMRMFIRAYGEDNLKLPPDSADASFMTELSSIAFPKSNNLTAEFNRV